MGRPKAEKKSNGNVARRQADLKRMCGSVDTQEPKPFNPNFMGVNPVKNTEINDPKEKMMRDELETYINNFVPYSGQDFDDSGVINRFFVQRSNPVLGIIDGRRMICLMCIDRIKDLTIEEFTEGVVGPARSNPVTVCSQVDIIADWMAGGIVVNHRLTPAEKESGRKDYTPILDKKLELTADGRQLLFKMESLLDDLTRNLLIDAVTRRDIYIQRLRAEKKNKQKAKKSRQLFSEDNMSAIAKLKELLAHK